ncbi:Vacuolar protein sorting-associated protein 9b [Beauveria bassiana D1-5]|uniref:Vacuolar protein sorting-associated protein 9b n=1 Tax=Beauveria bassiana D1-5 TaxID=1245745 RepID=A0A0A2VW43_BEABA|nr:Vacuolar protein sorting-associated protein 9b [Beauveria bassiana D1-5]
MASTASSDRPVASSKPAAARINSHDASQSRQTSTSTQLPKRAHTFHNDGATQRPDAFETSEDADDHDEAADTARKSVDLDELPIELVSLTDSFIESLSAKVHSTPPNIDKLSQLFQDFYALASSHVQTHISALATRQRRGPSPSPSPSSISSAASRLRARTASLKSKDSKHLKAEAEQQMITPDELADRKRARKALEAKKGRIEEAAERRLCEAIYGRIYRHRSTQDEAQDDKLRSKTAALALVNIGLTDLGIDLGQDDSDDTKDGSAPTSRDEEIRASLEPARRELVAMSDSHYPLGKINHLKAVHKSIVDTLSRFQPSADLHFMQRFRWEPKLTGEAAYCLTNFEAAISFLETVDLSTLREDEHPSGPPKAAAAAAAAAAGETANRPETFPPAYTQGTTETSKETATATKPITSSGGLKPATVLRNRRLSDLVNTPAQAFGVASGAVLSTADQGLQTISNSLGESYSFLVGKLRERQQAAPKESIVVPRTLDDARKLVSTPPLGDDDDAASVDTIAEDGAGAGAVSAPHGRDSAVLTLIGGRRDPSADSTRSRRSTASSLKKVEFANGNGAPPLSPLTATTTTTPTTTVAGVAQQQGAAMLDQVRSLGSSFNPMARLPSMGFRGFGRAAASTPPPPAAAPKEGGSNNKVEDGGDLSTVSPPRALQSRTEILYTVVATMTLETRDKEEEEEEEEEEKKVIANMVTSQAFPDLAAALPPKPIPKTIPKIAPPNKRFMEISTPGELRLGEVLDLLRDYRRLAGALKNLDAFEDK